jgi:hypothetical protein
MKFIGRPTKYKKSFRKIAYSFLSRGYSKEALKAEKGENVTPPGFEPGLPG